VHLEDESASRYGGVLLHDVRDLLDGDGGGKDGEGRDGAAGGDDRRGE